MSPFYFHRQFKAITGLTPKAYGAAHRAKKVRAELADRKTSVTSAIYGAGFNSNSRFYESSNKVLGMTPTAYKQGGKDARSNWKVIGGRLPHSFVIYGASPASLKALTRKT